ncbi:unnamed protein product [Tuber melanosporum]|uniref:(Perigord truffle) hypothetical protein n=1 Tax=Tuber melanosporum (strain Mel28) TaxID=656061 RepID=D5G6I8_TUBMM|nr:uncharacterized protein GSTUM_00004499001 [Tuber melanosporum]CAZ80131.1 unnamed protein product [Tuber melanosporum]
MMTRKYFAVLWSIVGGNGGGGNMMEVFGNGDASWVSFKRGVECEKTAIEWVRASWDLTFFFFFFVSEGFGFELKGFGCRCGAVVMCQVLAG